METAKVMEAQRILTTETNPESPGREEVKKVSISPWISKVAEREPVCPMSSATISGEEARARDTKKEMINSAGAKESRNP
jgi:hypothetical protein